MKISLTTIRPPFGCFLVDVKLRRLNFRISKIFLHIIVDDDELNKNIIFKKVLIFKYKFIFRYPIEKS